MPQTFGVLEIDGRTGTFVSRILKKRRGKQKPPPPPRELYRDSLLCFNTDKSSGSHASSTPHPNNQHHPQLCQTKPIHTPLTDPPTILDKDTSQYRAEMDYHNFQPAFSRSPSVDINIGSPGLLPDVDRSPYLSTAASTSSGSIQSDYPENNNTRAHYPPPFTTQEGDRRQPSNFLYSHALLQPVCAFFSLQLLSYYD